MKRFMSRAAGLIAAGLCLAASAVADMPAGSISAFNKAVESGDTASIVEASRTLGKLAMDHPEDTQSAVAAFQAATQLCLRGACGEARPMAAFLMAMEEGLPASRAEVEILSAYADWSDLKEDKAANAAFGEVLKANTSADPSLLTVSAYEAFYVARTGTTQWKEIAERSGYAAEHLKRVRDLLPNRWATAELVNATAAFRDYPDFDTYDQVSDLSAWVEGKGKDRAARKELRKIGYETEAWESALNAYFHSGHGNGRQYKKRMEIARERADAITAEVEKAVAKDAEDGGEPNFCKGRMVVPPEPSYPISAAERGYVGAVILGVNFKDGEVSGYEVLAAVPDRTFEKASIDGMKHFRWKFDKVQEDPDCTRTKETAMVQAFEYVIR